MNCAEFENVVVGMVRAEMADAGARDGALAHAGICGRCLRRLADEKMLSAAFLAVASEDAVRDAPPVVEKMLVTAFREHQTASRNRNRAWITRAVAGAAAAVLVVAGSWALRHPEPAAAPPAVASPAISEPRPGAPVYREVVKPPARTLRASRQPRVETPETPMDDIEEMTDFIPVVYDATPIELGRVVRVQLPREALIAFGLPFQEQDLENELIGADVLLGDDGLAQAVRFVR